MRILRAVMALLLAIGMMVGASPARAWNDQPTFFANDIIDTDNDSLFDLSVCFGDNESQGVYLGRSHLLERLRVHFSYINVGDSGVINGMTYDRGFTSGGVCQSGDGSSIHIHYESMGVEPGPVAYAVTDQNIRQCHIYLNSNLSFSWELPTEGLKHDGGAVVTHELLHCWGLNHSNNSGVHNSLMHAAGDGHHEMNIDCAHMGQTMWITADDIAGARGVYEFIYYWWAVADLKDSTKTAPASPCTD